MYIVLPSGVIIIGMPIIFGVIIIGMPIDLGVGGHTNVYFNEG